jgi:purine nucleoside phosphorylase
VATPHIGCEKGDIAKDVIMSGDPLRAKYIAEHYLTDYKLVNEIRNMYAYTGYYKGKRITVMGHGMGIPSIGLYTYELYKFYDVQNIIRVGSCGSYNKDVKVLDILLASSAYSKTFFDDLLTGEQIDEVGGSKVLNERILKTSQKINVPVKYGKIITSDVFDVYVEPDRFRSNFPVDKFNGVEMEAFGLFFVARHFKKDAACLLTVVDSCFENMKLSSNEREKGLNDMILLALESVL